MYFVILLTSTVLIKNSWWVQWLCNFVNVLFLSPVTCEDSDDMCELEAIQKELEELMVKKEELENKGMSSNLRANRGTFPLKAFSSFFLLKSLKFSLHYWQICLNATSVTQWILWKTDFNIGVLFNAFILQHWRTCLTCLCFKSGQEDAHPAFYKSETPLGGIYTLPPPQQTQEDVTPEQSVKTTPAAETPTNLITPGGLLQLTYNI